LLAFGARCVKGTIKKQANPAADDIADCLSNGDKDEIDVRLYVQMSDFSPNEHVRIYLFACVHNAGRSQMAAALCKPYAAA
jgi:hypothetical protein